MKERVLMVALAVSVSASSTFANETASWNGRYEGYVVCDRVADGVGSNFGLSVVAEVLQDGDELHLAIGGGSDTGDSTQNSLYRGQIRGSATGEMESGFLETCRPDFPYRELVRIFPAVPTQERFGFAADSIFVSDMLPGAEGSLVVESCKWALNRVSREAPEIDVCDDTASAGFRH